MASSSDGRGGLQPRYSSMKQPPLIKQLKGILADYPDGGQIIKELLQNAEDAGARKVQILYDGRRINRELDENTAEFTKFFQGPALCLYNDAQFTDTDWDGIRMIYSSVKEEDKLKVGRFGLGFKSVFHITDYPFVISGNQMLLINPQQSPDKVNAMIDVSAIPHTTGMDLDAVMATIDGTFGFGKETINNNFYKGTLFWFPLRESESVLSSNLYDESKVISLLEGFKEEAHNLLIFLKSIDSVTLSVRKENESPSVFGEVEIIDTDRQVQTSRENFKQELATHCLKDSDISCSLFVTIRSQFLGVVEEKRWLVVNYVVGKSASNNFKKLINNKDLGYSPCVGIATCIDSETPMEGHIFCFLPLPREGSRLTGLPFHVNGFFALSQNRHHLKWSTDQQKGKKIDDPSILWNDKMISEALPRAYEKMFCDLRQLSIDNRNSQSYVRLVYNVVPDASLLLDKWGMFISRSMDRLAGQPTVYCQFEDEWVSIENGIFTTFKGLSDELNYVKPSVRKCLSVIGKCHIDVSLEMFDSLKKYFGKVTNLTPQLLSSFLKQSHEYQDLHDEDKLDVLAYLLSDKEKRRVEDISLMPLASGAWVPFKRHGPTTYACKDPSDLPLFIGHQQRFLDPRVLQSKALARCFKEFIPKGGFQLTWLDDASFKQLITAVINEHLDNGIIHHSSPLNQQWLQNLWRALLNCGEGMLINLPVFPVPLCDSLKLIALSTEIVLLNSEASTDGLSEAACKCFELLGVHIVSSLPAWIPLEKVRKFVFTQSQDDISAIIEKVSSSPGHQKFVKTFDEYATETDKFAFVEVLAKCSKLREGALTMLKKLRLFIGIDMKKGPARYVSVEKCRMFIEQTTEDLLPDDLAFLETYIKTESRFKGFLCQLGAQEKTLNAYMNEYIKHISSSKFNDEYMKFINHFVNNFGLFENNKELVEKVKHVKFLRNGKQRVRAQNVYDPTDEFLRNLFSGEDVFPVTSARLKSKHLVVLRKLGMKTISNVTAVDLLGVARLLDKWVHEGRHTDEVHTKSEYLMRFLNDKPIYLKSVCSGNHLLYQELERVSWVAYRRDIPPGVIFPSCIDWYKHEYLLCKPSDVKDITFWHTIGSVMPLVQNVSEEVLNCFGWKSPPPITKVIEQLQTIKNAHLNPETRIEILPLLKTIYQVLSDRQNECLKHYHTLKEKELIWTGKLFTSPQNVIIRREKNDLCLEPYLYFMPEEYHSCERFLLSVGCLKHQTMDLLLSVFEEIEEKYKTGEHVEEIVLADRKIISSVIDRLAEIKIRNPSNIKVSSTKMMIKGENDNILYFANVHKCSYIDEKDWFDDTDDSEDDTHIIHEMINIESAKILGVRTYNRQCLIDAEDVGIEEWGQSEKLTTRISRLLEDGYTDGLSVPKELIQNADDAGAHVVKFLYDERENTHARKRLFTKQLEDCQGPALWVFNDSTFTEKDFKSITKLAGATKSNDNQTIGKFGLGFCSVYNVTDVPSFVSGSNLVIFDPHENYLKEARQTRGTGLKVNLANRKILKIYEDQFKPYEGIFDFRVLDAPFSAFNGTIFRLPLRTQKQAIESEICQKPYSKSEMHNLLCMLIQNAGNLLLFSQNVTTVEIWSLNNLSKTPSDALLCFRITKELLSLNNGHTMPFLGNNLTSASKKMAENEDYSETKVLRITEQNTYEIQKNKQISTEGETVICDWVVSWAMCLTKFVKRQGLVPLATVASPLENRNKLKDLINVPEGFYNVGHVFCFMPLPIQTDLPIHINGVFEVKSDRTGLVTTTEDDKDKSKDLWNETVMRTSLVAAFIQHLQGLLEIYQGQEIDYWSIWPCQANGIASSFVNEFYRVLHKHDAKVFRSGDHNVGFDKMVCLDTTEDIAQIIVDMAAEVLSDIPFGTSNQFVSLPTEILRMIKKCNFDKIQNLSKTLISEEEFLRHCLVNIKHEFWDKHSEDRAGIVQIAIARKLPSIDQILQTTECIPTRPDGRLKMIRDLVHPKTFLANLFSEKSERFPVQSFTDNALKRLVELGMHDIVLSSSLLLECCEAIEPLAKICSACALDRIGSVIEYLQNRYFLRECKDADTFKQIQSVRFLPVMKRPADWPVAWFSDLQSGKTVKEASQCSNHETNLSTSFLVEAPKRLFRRSAMHCVGSLASIVDENFFLHRNIYISDGCLKELGLLESTAVPIDLALKQIDMIGNNSENFKDHQDEMCRICQAVYDRLETFCSSMSDKEVDAIAAQYNETFAKPIILLNNRLLKSENIALNIYKECPPYFFQLPYYLSNNRKRMFKLLGVKESFVIQDMLRVLSEQKTKYGASVCKEIETITLLLENIAELMQSNTITFNELLDEQKNLICAPDTSGVLFGTRELTLQDPELMTSVKIKCLHESIAPRIGKIIGVQSKKSRLVKNISKIIPFGQQENLITRLNGLLKDYPCDESIMKELIQNADDAGATEIAFIRHFDSFHAKQAFGESVTYGPALCIYNNSYFREEDFEGIRSLGIGSKTCDPTKTGQYGIGFNAVYHLTDEPSFISKGPGMEPKGELCIFDPLLKHIYDHTDVGNPGLRCSVDGIEETFPDILKGYPDIIDKAGTMFRLQLREYPSPICKHCWTMDSINEVIERFMSNMGQCLHFVKNIERIRVLSCKQGNLTEDYFVKSTMSREDKQTRTRFFEKVNKVAESNLSDKSKNLCREGFDVKYTMKINDSKKYQSTWLILNQFGTMNNVDDTNDIKAAFECGELGMLPFGGVSIPLPNGKIDEFLTKVQQTDSLESMGNTFKCEGAAFCFLPLPGKTGLPFNVNGHFAVDRARRGLWNEGIRKTWNKYILQNIVADLIVTSIKALQHIWVNGNMEHCTQTSAKRRSLFMYHNNFPLYQSATDPDWQFLVQSFYKTVIEYKHRLFPVLIKSDQTCIRWVSLAQNEKDLADGGVFNTIPKFITTKDARHLFSKDDASQVLQFLKKVGLNVVETPKQIRNAISNAKISDTITSDPLLVINFLKQTVQQTNIPIENSIICHEKMVKSLLRYVLMSDKVAAEDLPLKLTNDSVLRKFEKTSPTFCTTEHKLLPASADLFMHHDLIFDLCLHKQMFEEGFLKKFSIRDLEQNLEKTYDPSIYRQGHNIPWKECEKMIRPDELHALFQFIYHQSLGPEGYIDFRLFHANLNLFDKWAFLPAVRITHGMPVCELIPIENSHLILTVGMGNEPLQTILDRFNIPVLDEAVLRGPDKSTSIPYAVRKITASTDHPDEMLKCLVYYKDRMTECGLTCKDANILLSFFCHHLPDLRNTMKDTEIKSYLRKLPIYETIFGTTVCLNEMTEAILLPKSVPTNGLLKWSDLNVLFLKQYPELKQLFKLLAIPEIKVESFYAEKIVPRISRLPVHDRKTHVEFIKSNILTHDTRTQYLSPTKRKIITALKELPFIQVAGDHFSAASLYCKHDKVFKEMIPSTKYLPDAFDNCEWKSFLVMIGFNTEPTLDLLLKFAKDIARDAALRLNDTIIKKANEVCNCLLKMSAEPKRQEQLSKLASFRHIKFVVPFIPDATMTDIFKSFVQVNSLVAFDGSVESSFKDVCWTSLPLIQNCPESKLVKKQLGIYCKPPTDKVIKHAQNICEVFSKQIANGEKRNIEVTKFMTPLYKYLDEKIAAENCITSQKRKEMIKKGLKNTDFVYIPNKALKKPSEVFTSTGEEVLPYLYKAPKEFQRYFDLFEAAGASESLTCVNYISVLATIKSQYGESSVPTPTLKCAAKVIENIFSGLNESETLSGLNTDNPIYLPDNKRILIPSAMLTVSDNREFEEKLAGPCQIRLFIGFNELELYRFQDPFKPFLILPDTHKPRKLSSDVASNVNEHHIRHIESTNAIRLQKFLRSTEFVGGVIRLLHHQIKHAFQNQYKEEDETNIKANFSNVCVDQVIGLQTFLSYRGQTIEGTNTDKTSYIRRLNNSNDGIDQHTYQLYFQVEKDLNLMEILTKLLAEPEGLLELILKCTNDKLGTISVPFLLNMVHCIQKPNEISSYLNSLCIGAYNTFPASRSVFPAAGTIVEAKFYPFIVQNIAHFEEHEFEYVAYISDVDESDDDNNVYIYANILRELPRTHGSTRLAIRYEINIGTSGVIHCPIVRLCKFLPQETNAGQELQILDAEPIGDEPFDDTCRTVLRDLQEAWTWDEDDKKVLINRLLKRWHPDRNMHQQEYASRIFNFIKETIVRLEQKKITNVVIDDNTGRTSPDMSTSKYSHLSSTVYESGKVIAQGYRENISSYTCSGRVGGFTHLQTEREPVPCLPRANKWMRQAKQDYKTALAALRHADDSTVGYNWICYNCHQACEKALKAAWYAKDANKCPEDEHELRRIVHGLKESDLDVAVGNFETVLGSSNLYKSLQYPSNSSIPSDTYTKDQAEKIRTITKTILDMVDDLIDI